MIKSYAALSRNCAETLKIHIEKMGATAEIFEHRGMKEISFRVQAHIEGFNDDTLIAHRIEDYATGLQCGFEIARGS